jgi:hypothetical protein
MRMSSWHLMCVCKQKETISSTLFKNGTKYLILIAKL